MNQEFDFASVLDLPDNWREERNISPIPNEQHRQQDASSMEEMEPEERERASNAERRPRSRAPVPRRGREWCVTSFEEGAPEFNAVTMRFLCFQRERCPDTGRLHWQVYVEFFDAIPISTVQRLLKLPAAHCENRSRKSTRAEARAYCQKADSSIAGSYTEFGTWREVGQGARTDLQEAIDRINQGQSNAEVARAHPTVWVRNYRGLQSYRSVQVLPRSVRTELHIICGPAGSGKTYTASNEWREFHPDWKLYRIYSGKNSGWYDGYAGQQVVLVDNVSSATVPDYDEFLQLVDEYPYQVPYKGGFVEWCPLIIYVTSVHPPSAWFPGRVDFSELARRVTTLRKFTNVRESEQVNANIDDEKMPQSAE